MITKLKNGETIVKGEENIANNITSTVFKSMVARVEKIEKNITPKVIVSKNNVLPAPS